MGTTFLDAAVGAGLLDGSRASAYEGFLDWLQRCPGVTVPIHGLELHLTGAAREAAIGTADFACLVEGVVPTPSLPWSTLVHALQPSLDCSSAWIEFDGDQWEPPNPQPKGLPLLYFSPTHPLSPEALAQTKLSMLLSTLHDWLKEQRWSGAPAPDELSLRHWLENLPKESMIQQIGLAFRDGKIQPRVLLNLPEPGATLKLLEDQQAPQTLRSQQLEGQMLVAAAFPHPVQELMGLELLADRCSLHNLRQMRQHPRLRGSRLERLIRDLGLASSDRLIQLSSIERRSSRQTSDGLQISLRGINHLKAVLRQGRLIALKTYLGEVNNHFTRTMPDAVAH